MKHSIVVLLALASLAVAGNVYAQEAVPGPGKLEVSIIPGGGTWFTKKDAEPEFSNYDYGAGAAYNFSRIVGVEGEVAGAVGLKQTLNSFVGKQTTPNMLSYSANVVANLPGHAVVPYATGGVGGMSVFEKVDVGVPDTETFFTGNLGGGVKWFASNSRWGLRGDYRLVMVKSKGDVTSFFGAERRYGNRIYGAVVINAVK
jgi:hypothetical protein